RTVVDEDAYVGDGQSFGIFTSWIETEFDNRIEPYAGGAAEEPQAAEPERVTVEVGGKRPEEVLPSGLGAATGQQTKSRKRSGGRKAASATVCDVLVSAMQGTIVKLAVTDGDEVVEGDQVVVIEAMKMEQPLTAHKAGSVTGLSVAPGETISAGAVVCEIKD